MRKIVPECRALDSTPIEEIAIDPRMRDDMSAVLKGLQSVYCKAESRAALFTIAYSSEFDHFDFVKSATFGVMARLDSVNETSGRFDASGTAILTYFSALNRR